MLNWFKKESKVLRKKITTRVLVIALAVIALAVSGTVLMAGWVDDNPLTPGQVIYTNPATSNVGIATTNPTMRLTIPGNQLVYGFTNKYTHTDFSTGLYISPYNNAIPSEGLGLWTSNQGHTMIGNLCDSDAVGLFFTMRASSASHGLMVMSLFGNGNVGIGTTSMSAPSSKLLVVGTTTSTSYACSSDARYKKNISTYQSALKKVLGLRGVSYFWKTDKYKDKNFSKDKQIGFIAQEVEKMIPELVYTDDKGYKTMSYDRLTAVLVEAVKELKAQSDMKISALSKENAELKKQLASLSKLNDRMTMLEKAVESNKLATK